MDELFRNVDDNKSLKISATKLFAIVHKYDFHLSNENFA